MSQYTDILGTPINIGSRVIYATTQGRSAHLRQGKVVKITPGNPDWRRGRLKAYEDAIGRAKTADEKFFAEDRFERAKKLDYKITIEEVKDVQVQPHPDDPGPSRMYTYYRPKKTLGLRMVDRWIVIAP
jgi:hypothetical protein